MTNAIYLSTTEPFSGKSVIALGLMNLLSSKTAKIAYFKPVISSANPEDDTHLFTIAKHFGLSTPFDQMFAFTRSEWIQLCNTGRESYIIDTVIGKFKRLQETHDFVVVEGTDFMGGSTDLEFDGNISIARNLGLPVALIVRGDEKSVQEVVDSAVANARSYTDNNVQVLTVVANKIDPGKEDEIKTKLQQALPNGIIATSIPQSKELSLPTMKEVFESVGGTILFGENQLSNSVDHPIVGAMQLHNCLTRISKDTLIVTPGDRGDIIIGALQANLSKNYPKISGIILTGGLTPEPTILELIRGLDTVVPIIQVPTGTFKTVTNVSKTQPRISPDNKERISLAINLFDKHVDIRSLEKKIVGFRTTTITPRMFQYQLVKRAKEKRKHIVLPEGDDDRILIAADMLEKQDIVDLTILGVKENIEAAALRLNLSLNFDKIKIIVGSSRVDLQACKLEYSIVSPK